MTAQQNEVGAAGNSRIITPNAGNIYASTYTPQAQETRKTREATNSFAETTSLTTRTISNRHIIKTANETKEEEAQSEQHANNNNNKFLERVLAAMNNSSLPKSSAAKPPIPPTSLKNGLLPNSVVDNAKTLVNGTGRNASKHVTAHTSVSTISSTNFTRPLPLPTSSSTVLETQPHMVRKQTGDNLENFTQQHDSFVRHTSQLSHTPRVNGYGVGVSATTSIAGKFNNDVNNVDQNKSVDVLAPIMSVSLKLPLSKADKMATSTTTKYYGGVGDITTCERQRHTSSYFSTRSPSPANSLRSTASSSRCSSISNATTTSRTSFSRLQTPPRRVFPQTYMRGNSTIDVYEMQKLESSPVVFDANLSFVLGCKRQPVHQTVRPLPSYQEDQTSSAYLSEKIQNFLRRTDHVQEEWSALGRRSRRTGSTESGRATPTNSLYDDYDTISLIERQRERKSMERASSIGRSRSTQNILTKAFQLSKTLPSTPTSRSNSMAREVSESGDDHTIHEENDNDFDEVGHRSGTNHQLLIQPCFI